MKTIIYKFCDGTSKSIEVSDELYNNYMDMEKQDKSNQRRETRRHISLDYLADNGIEIADKEKDIFENEDIQDAIKQLLPSQQELIRKIYVEGLTASEVAKIEGVDKSAISKRLSRIYKQLKKFCVAPSTIAVSGGYKCRHNTEIDIKETNNE